MCEEMKGLNEEMKLVLEEANKKFTHWSECGKGSSDWQVTGHTEEGARLRNNPLPSK